MTAMPPEDREETRRVRDEIAARLRGAGVPTSDRDSSEGLARLLDAVEDFERVVRLKGGDLMVDEPIGSGRPLKPDDRFFVLPKRGESEPIPDFIDRIAEARARAAGEPPVA